MHDMEEVANLADGDFKRLVVRKLSKIEANMETLRDDVLSRTRRSETNLRVFKAQIVGGVVVVVALAGILSCLLYTSPSPRD